MKKFTKIALLVLLLATFTLSGCSLSGCTPGSKQAGPDQLLTIEWWGVGKNVDYFSRAIDRFEGQYSNIKINYTAKNAATYEEELVNALAADTGPDVVMIRSDWFDKHRDKLTPKTLDEESKQEVEDTFLPLVNNVLLQDNQLYGLALDIDTLGLYYNEDLFSKERLKLPPTTWQEFNNYVKKLTKKSGGNITRAGAAIGTSNNIDNSQDILMSLMLQNGTKISSADGLSAAFHNSVQSSNNQPIYTGRKALEFYTSFADPQKTTYTWDNAQPEAWRAFAQGKVGMMFDYFSRADDIYNLNPELDFEFAKMPQIQDAQPEHHRVYARFWSYCVTNNNDNLQWTWFFLQNLADQMADSSLVEEVEREKEATIGEDIFIGQGAIAKTVYKSVKPADFDEAFQIMINNIVVHNQKISTAIDTAANTITELYQLGSE